MFCPKCRNQLEDGVSFCSSCGCRIADVQEKQLASYGGAPAQMKSKSSGGFKIWMLPLMVLATAAIVIIVIVFLPKSSLSVGGDHYYGYDNDSNDNYDPALQSNNNGYQNTNSYEIPCNGNTDLAIEAANVFADKYGGYNDFTVTQVDASVNLVGTGGTYRYTYIFCNTTYTKTVDFSITDYGSYRNYAWNGDFADLFYY